MGPDVTFVNKN